VTVISTSKTLILIYSCAMVHVNMFTHFAQSLKLYCIVWPPLSSAN